LSKERYKEKISAALEALAEALSKCRDRQCAVEVLKSVYERRGVQPFRGAAVPEDIFDKEMATLYVVGKYGVGLDQDYPELFGELFEREERYEEALRALLERSLGAQERRKRVEEVLGRVDGNELARVFRIAFTKALLGFGSESELVEALRSAAECFPELEREVKNYGKFYIGFKIAEKISAGEIRSRIEKEAEKRAMNISVGLGSSLPDDKYIYAIAKAVFGLPKSRAEKVLKLAKRRRRSGVEGSKESGPKG